MPESDLPAEVKRLIADALSSMDHVEVLFHVHQSGAIEEPKLAGLVHLDPNVVRRVVRDLAAAGLLVETEGAWRIADADRGAIEKFVAAYNARPVTLVRAVYSRASPITTFADAFRIRRDD